MLSDNSCRITSGHGAALCCILGCISAGHTQFKMADEQRMERTWLSSVLFMDIVNYSSQSVELQMKWKARFNEYLAEAIQTVPKDERVIVDTGDGAAVCFLGSPEAAMFASLQLWQRFIHDEQEHQPGLRVRIGVNLGPVKLVRDLNGNLNAIGDGINAGQRIMSFAPANQILVSQSFFEVVSRLSDDYKALFKLKGVETDKHVREHTVYSLLPPGSDEWNASRVAPAGQPVASQAPPVSAPTPPPPPTATRPVVQATVQPPVQKGSPVLLLLGVALVVLVLLVGAAFAWWRFSGLGTKSASPSSPAVAQAPAPTTVAPPVPQPETKTVAESTPATPPPLTSGAASPGSAPVKQPTAAPHTNEAKSVTAPPSAPPTASKSIAEANVKPLAPPVDDPSVNADPANTLPAQPTGANISGEAQTAYEQAMRFINQRQPADAVPNLDRAIRANPGYAFAYLARAQARRMMSQYDISLQDCNAAIRISPQEPRAHLCRGLGEAFLKQWDQAAIDYGKAIRLNPDFVLAYEGRGVAYINLGQYDRALEDINQAIRLRPTNGQFYMRRGVIDENLNRYKQAVKDYDEAIRLEPRNPRAYLGRARARQLTGDERGAEADRRYARQLKRE